MVGLTPTLPNPTAIGELLVWAKQPTADGKLEELLASLSNDDLLTILTFKDTDARPLAWAEFGRRNGFLDMDITMVVAEDTVNVHYGGKALALHPLSFKEPA